VKLLILRVFDLLANDSADGSPQDRLGHTEAQTTMGYTHAVKADERRVANELGKILHVTARNEQEERPAPNALTVLIQ
jgi:hypothetical protein